MLLLEFDFECGRAIGAAPREEPRGLERVNRRACVLRKYEAAIGSGDFALTIQLELSAQRPGGPPSIEDAPIFAPPRSPLPLGPRRVAGAECPLSAAPVTPLPPPPALALLSRFSFSAHSCPGRRSWRAAKGPVCPMRLFIAEKPSLARAIADALPPPQRRTRLHIECGDGDVIAWCAGHILHMAPPEAYGAEYKTWRLEHLPIAPRAWRLEVSAPELLQSIARLLKTAKRVVHAGDPDREGQLLVDEVLHFLGYRGPVDRLLVRDLSPEAVGAQHAALEPNAKYRALSESALARQRADWLYGINMTRLYTLLGRAAGYGGVLSIGRVQTPLLGLVVARDRAIAQFRPVDHYGVAAEMAAGGGESFRAVWVPGAGEALDAEGRLVVRAVAEGVIARLLGKPGRVTVCTEEKRTEAAPSPHALADLQMEAGRRHGMSAAESLAPTPARVSTRPIAS